MNFITPDPSCGALVVAAVNSIAAAVVEVAVVVIVVTAAAVNRSVLVSARAPWGPMVATGGRRWIELSG